MLAIKIIYAVTVTVYERLFHHIENLKEAGVLDQGEFPMRREGPSEQFNYFDRWDGDSRHER
jgi:hypothetical protein